jgi:aspartyl-tRNA(Asn)/glutamyl-tRNA(Gln) amidotransferase subunit C
MTDISKYEAMAKFDLPSDEAAEIHGVAERLLREFSAIQHIDTEGVEPLTTVLNTYNVMREDIPSKSISRDELLENAPAQYDGYFQVPETL